MKNKKHAFKRAAEDVHAVAADHDDLTVGNEYLDVYDDQKAGLTMTVFVIIYAMIVGLLYFYNRSLILAD